MIYRVSSTDYIFMLVIKCVCGVSGVIDTLCIFILGIKCVYTVCRVSSTDYFSFMCRWYIVVPVLPVGWPPSLCTESWKTSRSDLLCPRSFSLLPQKHSSCRWPSSLRGPSPRARCELDLPQTAPLREAGSRLQAIPSRPVSSSPPASGGRSRGDVESSGSRRAEHSSTLLVR